MKELIGYVERTSQLEEKEKKEIFGFSAPLQSVRIALDWGLGGRGGGGGGGGGNLRLALTRPLLFDRSQTGQEP